MIFVVVGPTGSGKTDIAIKVSERFNLPIVNADAFQIYKKMNIGTAKISSDHPLYKNHYLLDIVEPSETYSVKQYREDFDSVFPNLLKQNKDIIICGGTGLYLRATLFDYVFPEEENVDLSKYESMSNEELYERLKDLDPVSANTIHINNRKRVIRALAFVETNKISKSENISKQEHKYRFKDVEILFLNPNREELYENINKRVDEMFDKGLVEEVKNLLKEYDLSLTARQAIGYKEVIDYLNGELNLEQCKELIKKRSRNYAKRQVTFFKHQFKTVEFSDKKSLLDYILERITK